jgi:hypothetical protein
MNHTSEFFVQVKMGTSPMYALAMQGRGGSLEGLA